MPPELGSFQASIICRRHKRFFVNVLSFKVFFYIIHPLFPLCSVSSFIVLVSTRSDLVLVPQFSIITPPRRSYAITGRLVCLSVIL